MSIKKEIFDEIKKLHGSHASWCIWKAYNEKLMSPKDGIDDMSIFANENDIIKDLNDQYIFVGLNGASHDSKNKGQFFANFHSSDKKRQQDYKLRFALQGTKFWGSYITDLFLIEETDSKELKRKIDDRIIQESIKRLESEIDIINTNAKIIAIGSDAYKYLSENFKDGYKVNKKISHYSNYISKEEYRDMVLEGLKDI